MARLAPRLKFIPDVSTENNAMRTLAVISGAGSLPEVQPFPVQQDNLTFEGFTLSEQQARIIGTLSFNNFTALTVNCGPGTGKTTTLVLSVLSRMENTESISLMTAMSNGAVAAAAEKLIDVDKKRRCKAVRFISNQNFLSVEKEHCTAIDFPIIWPDFLLNLVRRFDQRHEPLYPDIVDATIYLCRFGRLIRKSLRRADLRTAANEQPVKNKVDLMLLDEASQLPRYAFIAVCHTFPNARPVLIGDVHQLGSQGREFDYVLILTSRTSGSSAFLDNRQRINVALNNGPAFTATADWDAILQYATFCYNSTVHQTTGETPFFLVFGRDPTLTIERIIDPAPRSTKTNIPLFKEALITTLEEAWSEAAKNSQRAQEEYQKRANQGAQGSNLRTGDRVIYKDYHANSHIHGEKITKEGIPSEAKMEETKGAFETIEVIDVDDTDAGVDTSKRAPGEEAAQEDVEMMDAAE
uniref:Uncharacterized protein n=1 Tax=Caenorhabditis japonica TaxID=281687 RepID=A0A8R1ILD4_CAEJA